MESNTIGQGTIKKLRTGAVVSTLALSAFGVSTTVSAEEVAKPATTETTTATEPTKPTTEKVAEKEADAPKRVTQSDVDTAKANSDKANADVTKQSEKISNTQSEINKNQDTEKEIEKKIEDVKSVTSEKVADAKADSDAKAEKSKQADAKVSTAETKVSEKDTAVKYATKSVESAKSDADKKASDVQKAQDKVNSLKQLTDTKKLEKDVNDATAQVTKDQTAVNSAQTSLDNAKLAQANKEAAIKKAQQGVSTAETNLNDAKSALANAKTTKAEKDKAVTTTQTVLGKAKAELKDASVTNTITVSDEYIRLLKAYVKNRSDKSLVEQLKQVEIKEMRDHGYLGWNGTSFTHLELPYNAKESDKTKPVDVDNLTDEQAKDITLFAADLINQLRAKFGTEPVKVSEDSVKVAKELAKASTIDYGHDGNAYDKVSKARNNLLFSEDVAFNFDKATNMAELKKAIYSGIIDMLFYDEGSLWGHATSLLYLDTPSDYVTSFRYLGVATRSNSSFGTISHFVGVNDKMVTSGERFDKTKELVSDSATLLKQAQAKADQAQKAHDDAIKSAKQAQQGMSNAETVLSAKTTALADAKKQLSDLQNKVIDIPALEKALATAKSKLGNSTSALNTATERLNFARSSNEAKARALGKAEKDLETAKTTKAQADKVLADAKANLANLTKGYKDANAELEKLKQEQATVKKEADSAKDNYDFLAAAIANRETRLAELNTKLAEVNAKLETLRGKLKTAVDEWRRLDKVALEKALIFDSVIAAKEAQDEADRLKALKEKEQSILANGGVPTPIYDRYGKVVDYIDGKVVSHLSIGFGGKTYQAPAQSVEVKKQLPNTGTKESRFGLLGLSLLVGLGLGYKGKQRRG